jgi:TANK-binding kinase 1
MYEDFPVATFKSFTWSRNDIIGAGATSLVYKAICQDTGNYVAVKVFNDAAKSRSNVLQLRELDLLHKIKHENVVKLIDKDEHSINNFKYALRSLVMEYCNGGSLSSIIEQPENIYGLQQTEFLLVLRHMTCGMNELHKLKIVHRDIKPNNILLQILPTGEHVYKLSDFGAARQVEMDDDQFTSICGTEEYLFPDVYERALINRNIQKTFRAGIDLWSTGVTLYHVATGLLPFRPIGGRHNRETMIKITKDKPTGTISGVQNINDNSIEYSNKLPDTCQLSAKLQELIVPMLAGLMENNYDNMCTFEKFFEYSMNIYELAFINVMNLDHCQIIELPFRKTEKLKDLKDKILLETGIEINSQLIIFNNLLFDSLVTENQTIESYPIIDKEHPLIVFSLNNTMSSDDLGLIKQIPELRCKLNPKTVGEIILWSKETSGSIYYIKRGIYLVTMIIELLKLAAIAFKSYMPEMKLKQQNLLHTFKSTVKSLETKLKVIEKLDGCMTKTNLDSKSSLSDKHYKEIKVNIDKFKTEISVYENEINFLTERINATENLEFLVQNSNRTSKWKKEIDAYVCSSQEIFDELVSQKKEIRSKVDQEKFERSKFTEFKLKQETKIKEEAVKLYEETVVVQFYDFFLRFEKWMSDLIKLHNDLMSVKQKLIECEKSMNVPLDSIESLLDVRINTALDQIIACNALPILLTPAVSSNGIANSKESSMDSSKNGDNNSSTTSKDDNNNNFNSQSLVSSKAIGHYNIENFVLSLKEFKNQTIEIEKALDENAVLLTFLQEQFNKKQQIKKIDNHQI